MSDGVGVLLALCGSLPRIAPSLNPDLDDGVRSPTSNRSPDSVSLRKRPGRSIVPATSPRPAGETAATRALRLRPTPTAAPGRTGSGNPVTKTASLPSETLRRICEAGQAAQVRGASGLRLTLRPAHLGSLTIELSLRGSLLRGKIRTETRAARELILAEMDRLRKALEERGIRVGDLEVQVEAQARRPVEGRPQKDGNPESEASEGAAPRSVRRGKLDVLA